MPMGSCRPTLVSSCLSWGGRPSQDGQQLEFPGDGNHSIESLHREPGPMSPHQDRKLGCVAHQANAALLLLGSCLACGPALPDMAGPSDSAVENPGTRAGPT
jgi:hypothetical protein